MTVGEPGRDRLAGEGLAPRYDAPARRAHVAHDAGETGGGVDASAREGVHAEAADGVLDRLLGAVAAVQERPIDELTEEQLVDEVTRLDLAVRRLDARISRTTAAVSDRHAARARQAATGADESGRQRAASRARRQAERELAQKQQKNPGEVGRAVARGHQQHASPATRTAYDQGELPPRQALQLAETLRELDDDAIRAEAEVRLLAAAKIENPTTFGRTCRKLLALLDHRAATRAEDRRHDRRSASCWTTPDGMTVLNGQWATLQGNVITTAINAFRRHDAPDENRTSGQRFADALCAMAEAALRAGEAPTQHGIRPHVLVTVPWQAILDGAGVAYTADGDPLPYAHIRKLLVDCGVSRLLMDARGIPAEAGIAVRTVNAGLHKQLLERDRVCIGHGCTVPAQFCQVMHLGVPFRFGGRLTLETSGLGCDDHHDKFDKRGWRCSWLDARPVIHHPSRPPAGAQKRPPSSPAASPSSPEPKPSGTVGPPGNADPPDIADPPGTTDPPGITDPLGTVALLGIASPPETGVDLDPDDGDGRNTRFPERTRDPAPHRGDDRRRRSAEQICLDDPPDARSP